VNMTSSVPQEEQSTRHHSQSHGCMVTEKKQRCHEMIETIVMFTKEDSKTGSVLCSFCSLLLYSVNTTREKL